MRILAAKERKNGKQIFYLIICFLFMWLNYPIVNAAAAVKQDHVRVLLTSLGSINRLQIGIYGAYSLENRMSFQSGSILQVAVVDQEIMLYYEGMTYKAGKSMDLIRHQNLSGQENGLRLQDSLALYPGDLKLSVKNGLISPVLKVPTEEYLMGVVPYEMSDDFPAEALKAQAVAARTYTLKNMKPDQAYDLVDNTNDQVYRGTDPSKSNAIEAVKATEGLTLTYQGSLAQTFYTASNGGYTESAFNAWKREDIAYLRIREDKYDLENPLSVVKTARLPKDINEDLSNLDQQLNQLLISKLQLHLKEKGYDNATDSINIERIASLEPIKLPENDSDQAEGVRSILRFGVKVSSRKMIKADQDTEVSFAKADKLPETEKSSENLYTWSKMHILPETFVIDLPVFPEIERIFGLSINISQNEILRVTEKTQEWVLSFARYGHGVGLSQRGAEQMAKQHQWNYKQILSFYYPGCNLKKFDMKASIPAPLNHVFITTPGPIPSPTPRPTLMPQNEQPGENQFQVSVTGIAQNSSLNLRANPNLAADVLMRLFYGQQLLVLEKMEDGWLRVKTDVVEGYVKEEFVSPLINP